MVEMPVDRNHPHLSRGYAYVEFETSDEAQKALKHMDGGRPECSVASVLQDYSVHTCWITFCDDFVIDRSD